MPRPRTTDPDHYMYTSSSRRRDDRDYDRGYDSADSQTLSWARLAEHNRTFERERLRKSSAPQLDEDYRHQERRRRSHRYEDHHSPVVDASDQFLSVFRPRPSVNLTRSSYNDLRARKELDREASRYFERPTTPSRRRPSSSAPRRETSSRQSNYGRDIYDGRIEDYAPVEATSVVQLFGERPTQRPPPPPPAPHRSYTPYLQEVRRSSFASGRPESLYTADPLASPSRHSSRRRGSVFDASSAAGDSSTGGRHRSLFGRSKKQRDLAPPLPSIHSGSALSGIQDREDRYHSDRRNRRDLYSEDYLVPPQPLYRERTRNSIETSRRRSTDTRRSFSADPYTSPKSASRRTTEQHSPQGPPAAAGPSLDPAMSTILSRFSSRQMGDHECKKGYPIAVFCGALSMDVGGITNSKVEGAYALFFGPGHPQNVQQPMSESEIKPSHLQNPKPPSVAATNRRAELVATTRALQAVHDLYRGKACAHICMDSAYVAKAWGSWIPKWEEEGWPGDEHVQQSRSHASSVGVDGTKKNSSKRLADEDLLRELAAIRRLYARAERKATGAAHLYLIDRTANPANKPCKLILDNMRLRSISPPPSPGALSPGRRDSKSNRRSMQADVNNVRQQRDRDLSSGLVSKRQSLKADPTSPLYKDKRASRSGNLISKRRNGPVAEIDESNTSHIAPAPLARGASVKSAASAVTALDEDETGARPAFTALEGVESQEDEGEVAAAEPKGMLASGLASATAILTAGITYSGLLARGSSPTAEEGKKVEAAVPDELDDDLEEEVPAYSPGSEAATPIEKAAAVNQKIPVSAVGPAGQSSKSPVLQAAAPIVVGKPAKQKKSAARSAPPPSDDVVELGPASSPDSPTKKSIQHRKSKMADAAVEKPLSPTRKSTGNKRASKLNGTPRVAGEDSVTEAQTEAEAVKATPARLTLSERKRVAVAAAAAAATTPVIIAQDEDASSSEDVAPTPKASSVVARKRSAAPIAATPVTVASASASENMTESEAEAEVLPMAATAPKKGGLFGNRKRAAPPVTPIVLEPSTDYAASPTPQKKGGLFARLRRTPSAAPVAAPALGMAAASPAALTRTQAPVAAPVSEVSAMTTDISGASEEAESAIEGHSVILEGDEEIEGQATPVRTLTTPVIPQIKLPEPPSGGRLINYGRRRAEQQAATAKLAPPSSTGGDASVVTVDEAGESDLAAVPSSADTNTDSAAAGSRVPTHPSQKTVRKQASMPVTRDGGQDNASLAASSHRSRSLKAGRFKSLSSLGGRKILGTAPEDEEWAKQAEIKKKRGGFLPWGKKGEKAPPVPALPASYSRKQSVNGPSRAAIVAGAEPVSQDEDVEADQTIKGKRSTGILHRSIAPSQTHQKSDLIAEPVVVAEDSPLEEEDEESERDTDLIEEEDETSEVTSALEGSEAAREVEEGKDRQEPLRPRSRLLSFSPNKKTAAAPPPASPVVAAKPAKEPFSFKKSLTNLVTLE